MEGVIDVQETRMNFYKSIWPYLITEQPQLSESFSSMYFKHILLISDLSSHLEKIE